MKPHGVCELGDHYHIRFEPKIGHGVCAIRWMPYPCMQFTSIMDKPWTPNIPSQQKPL